MMKTIQCTHPLHHHSGMLACCHKAIVVMRRWVHWIEFMISLYIYYAPCFELLEQSVS